MSRLYLVSDAHGERRFSEVDLPLCVGGAQHGDVVLPDASADAVAAYIAVADGHAYIQPADDASQLFHNHERLTESRWLKSGDRLQLGDALLDWRVQGDQVFVTVRRRTDRVQPSPPQDPAPPPAAASPATAPLTQPSALPRRHQGLRRTALAAFLLLVLAAAFVLIATPVGVRVTPAAAKLALTGFPPPLPLGGRWLALPGRNHGVTDRISTSTSRTPGPGASANTSAPSSASSARIASFGNLHALCPRRRRVPCHSKISCGRRLKSTRWSVASRRPWARRTAAVVWTRT